MMDIVRRNQVKFVLRVEADDGSVPTAAKLNIWYLDGAGVRQIVTLDMTQGVDGDWVASWPTDVAMPGLVEWAAWSEGPVQGATQGCFNLVANKAN